jgi:transcriptional regulator with XRE-family HTH domain
MTEQEFLAAVGTRVRMLRAARDLTQRELADAAGLHRTLIGRIEHGTVNFGVDTLRRLAQALRTTTTALVPSLHLADADTSRKELPVTDAWDRRPVDAPGP